MIQQLLGATLALAALGTLPSCDKTDLTVPAYTKEWLHDSDGAILRFRQGTTGALDSIRVVLVDNNSWISTGKFALGGYHEQRIDLHYFMSQPLPNAIVTVYPGLKLYFNSNNTIAFYELAGAEVVAQLIPYTDPAAEQLTGSYKTTAELLHNVTLNGRLYHRVAHLHLSQPFRPQAPEDFWYSREDGLVAYALPNSPAWYRR